MIIDDETDEAGVDIGQNIIDEEENPTEGDEVAANTTTHSRVNVELRRLISNLSRERFHGLILILMR